MKVYAITENSNDKNTYQVLLYDEESDYMLPIVIGNVEAQLIAIELEEIKTSRPLTHDLLINMISELSEDDIQEINIYNLEKSIYFCKLVMESGKEIECRTSDGIVLALKKTCPIFVNSDILEEVGLTSKDREESDNKEFKNKNKDKDSKNIKKSKNYNKNFEDLTDGQLENILNEAIKNEDYEKASKIKKELDNRKKE